MLEEQGKSRVLTFLSVLLFGRLLHLRWFEIPLLWFYWRLLRLWRSFGTWLNDNSDEVYCNALA